MRDVLPNTDLSLVCRVSTRLCALPLERVSETMRPLPVDPLAGASRPVRGIAIIRGVPMPVVDAGWLFTDEEFHPTRFVIVRVDTRRVALAVDAVIGVRPIPAERLNELPSLVKVAAPDAIAAIGVLDAELLVILSNTRLVPESVWNAVEAGEGSK